MDHQTIRRNAGGELEPMPCACGEDHGPSLAEQVAIQDEELRRLRAQQAESTGVFWGVRWPDGDVDEFGDYEEDARRAAAAEPHYGGELVKAVRGPWQVAT